MKLVSIDVGIKNLSFCVFEIDNSEETAKYNIIKWDNINLSEKYDLKCSEINKTKICNKPATLSKNGTHVCCKHSKNYNYFKPIEELTHKYLNKQKIQSLINIADKYNVSYTKTSKKTELLASIFKFIENTCYEPIIRHNATKLDLVIIARNIQHRFDNILSEHLDTIDTLIIENQIGPIANKMKTIQGMIAQYFIMRNTNINIKFISASNKLKEFLPQDTIDYKKRKKLSILCCMQLIEKQEHLNEWVSFFNQHTKKDDLADCFLQGLWFIRNKH